MEIIRLMERYADEHQDLFWKMDEREPSESVIAANEFVFEEIDDSDYYGWNLTGEDRMLRLMWDGCSTTGLFLPVGRYPDKPLDQIPVCDADLNDEDGFEYSGNFRSTMEGILDEWIQKKTYRTEEEFEELLKAKADLFCFSEVCID